jgi:hypothetical protein
MRRFALSMLTVVAMLASASALHAQIPYVTYYQPTTVYYSTPAVTTSSYTVASPVVTPAPVPTVTYYRAPVASYYPATPVITRYRPFLGNTVVRYPYRYSAPVVYYP